MTANAMEWQDALRVVERLSRTEQLQLITTLLQRIQNEITDDPPIDLLTLSGVGAEVWADLDVDAYLQQERDSWQD